jgi:hypothetical protein
MKKKFYLFSVCLVSFFATRAQINKGAILLGGNLNFSTNNIKPDSLGSGGNIINIAPSVGKAIRENEVVGIGLLYTHSDSKVGGQINSFNFSSNAFGASVFMRRYRNLGKHFYIFGQGSFGGDYLEDNSHDNGQPENSRSDKGFNLNFGFYPGISYEINNKIQLETGFNNLLEMQFSHNKTTGSGMANSTQNQFSFSSSLSNFSGLTVGIRFLINPA